MVYQLDAIVRFPCIVVGELVKDWIVDVHGNNTTVSYTGLDEPPVKPTPIDRNPPPEQLQTEYERAEQQRLVKVHVRLEAGNGRDAWHEAVGVVWAQCAWLSYLSLEPFRVTSWDALTGTDGSHIVMAKVPTEPTDHYPAVRHLSYGPMRVLNLAPWLEGEMNIETRRILKWLHKGMLTPFADEKLIFWATAMEAISESLEAEGNQIGRCPTCKATFPTGRPSSSKTGLLRFLREELGFSRSKIYDPIWKARSKFVHGAAVPEAQSAYTKALIDASWALLVAGTAYHLIVDTKMPFAHTDPRGQGRYEYDHPVFGRLEWLKCNLEALAGFPKPKDS